MWNYRKFLGEKTKLLKDVPFFFFFMKILEHVLCVGGVALNDYLDIWERLIFPETLAVWSCRRYEGTLWFQMLA